MPKYKIKIEKTITYFEEVEAENRDKAVASINAPDIVVCVENLDLQNAISKEDVHTEHCCLTCGCKYGKENCTVMREKKKQSFPCGQAGTCDWNCYQGYEGSC